MKMQESPEDYLETILILSRKQEYVRSIDVAKTMGYSKPSVSVAVKRLRENGYLTMDKENHHLILTEQGSAIANKIYERHIVLNKYLLSIGVSEETAANDACRIEHVISDETFDIIKTLCPAD